MPAWLYASAVRAACETIGRFLPQSHPREVTMEWMIDGYPG